MTRLRSAIAVGAVCAAAATTVAPGVAFAAAPGAVDAKSSKQTTVAAAQRELLQAKEDLARARVLTKTALAQRAAAKVSPDVEPATPEPAETTDAPFARSSSDVFLLAAMIAPEDPDMVLTDAPVENLATMAVDPADYAATSGAWETETTEATTPADVLRAADRQKERAEERMKSAKGLIKQLNNLGNADGPGAAKLGQLCAGAGVVVEVCEPTPWTETNLKFDSVMLGRYVHANWGQIKTVGGWRAGDPYPDHPSGRAVDIMMPQGGAGNDVELGNEIARYFQKHAKEYGIQYMIWRQRQWTTGSPLGAWNGMSDRGSPTANHMDHVHITVTDGDSGWAWKTLLKEARRNAR